MNKNNPSNQPSPKKNNRFILEIGFCILVALIFFMYFNPGKNQLDQSVGLVEIEEGLDALDEYRVLTVNSSLVTIDKGGIDLKLKTLDFYETLLDAMEASRPLPRRKAKQVRAQIEEMRQEVEELEGLLEEKKLIKKGQQPGILFYELEESKEKNDAHFGFGDYFDSSFPDFEDDFGDSFEEEFDDEEFGEFEEDAFEEVDFFDEFDKD